MRKLTVLLFVIPFFATAQLKEKIARIDSNLTYLYQHEFFNGTVLIGDRGKVIYKKAFGNDAAENGKPLTTTSSFILASVSKQFFAMMTMMLKEQGKLQYDDAVQKYLPSFLFDPTTVNDNSTFTNSTALSSGIEMVWVNGKLVYQNGKSTHEHPGKFVSKE